LLSDGSVRVTGFVTDTADASKPRKLKIANMIPAPESGEYVGRLENR